MPDAPDSPTYSTEAEIARLAPAPQAQLERYLDALLDETSRVNLTGPTQADPAAARMRLALPSFAVGLAWEAEAAPTQVVDIGSGNGFPGVVAAVLWPTARVWLVERRKKKADAIDRCLAAAGIDNATAVPLDARELPGQREDLVGTVDLMTARAVGPVRMVNEFALPLLAPGGRVVHWKASNTPEPELKAGDAFAAKLGWSRRMEWAFEPAPPGPSRLVVYERPPVGAR